MLVAGGCHNRYPGTAQQSGVIHLQLRGKKIAAAVLSFHHEHGRWPASLSELVQDGILASADLLYPHIYELPDRRDILGFSDGIEWIYIRPEDDQLELPLLIAPLPYTRSMGKRLARPKRIIVSRETVADTIEEAEIAKLVRNLAKD